MANIGGTAAPCSKLEAALELPEVLGGDPCHPEASRAEDIPCLRKSSFVMPGCSELLRHASVTLQTASTCHSFHVSCNIDVSCFRSIRDKADVQKEPRGIELPEGPFSPFQ